MTQNVRPLTFFISYNAGENWKIAQELHYLLSEMGHHTIRYKFDFAANADFVNEIATALTRCDYVIALVGPKYIQSNWCRKEYTVGSVLNRLIPFITHNCNTSILPGNHVLMDIRKLSVKNATTKIERELTFQTASLQPRMTNFHEVYQYVEEIAIVIPYFSGGRKGDQWYYPLVAFIETLLEGYNVRLIEYPGTIARPQKAQRVLEDENADVVLYGKFQSGHLNLGFVHSNGWEMIASPGKRYYLPENLHASPDMHPYHFVMAMLLMAFGNLDLARNRTPERNSGFELAFDEQTDAISNYYQLVWAKHQQISHFINTHDPVDAENLLPNNTTQVAKANPRFVAGIRILDQDSVYTNHLTLRIGDKLRVKLAVVNETLGNTIQNLHFYSAFGRDGILAWIQADSHKKVGVSHLQLSLPPNSRVKYIRGSTYYEQRDNNEAWEEKIVSDNQDESPLFINDSKRGLHVTGIPGGPNNQVVVYYDLEVISVNNPVFNIHESDQPVVQVRRKGNHEWHVSLDDILDGDVLEFKLYAHNHNRGTTAQNCRAGFLNWPEKPKQKHYIHAFITANNARRKKGIVLINSNSRFILEYVSNSTRFQGRTNLGQQPYNPEVVQTDGVVSKEGIEIGNDGNIAGCWEFLMTVRFEAVVRFR